VKENKHDTRNQRDCQRTEDDARLNSHGLTSPTGVSFELFS
jgi:hypothetical protein